MRAALQTAELCSPPPLVPPVAAAAPLLPLATHPGIRFDLHAAVGQRHGIVGQRVAGHLAVVGAADGGQGAHVPGAEGIPLVRPEETRAAAEAESVSQSRGILDACQQVRCAIGGRAVQSVCVGG